MSQYKDGSYGSLTGVTLLGKVLAGRCTIKYTKAVVGSGYIPSGMTPKTMTGPADYVMDAKIAAIANPVDGECQVTIQIKSDDVAMGFYATNIVLYAEDPDAGEVPYTYLSLENEPEWIRPASSIVGKLATFDLIAAVGDVDTVAACIDPEAIATVGRVEQMIAEHNIDSRAHDNLVGAKIVNVIAMQEEWYHDGDGYAIDVIVADMHETSFPIISLFSSSVDVAYKAGLSPSAQALDGAIRLWSIYQPTEDIKISVAILNQISDEPPIPNTMDLTVVEARKNRTKIIDIVIPQSSWTSDGDNYVIDVEVGEARSTSFPSIALHHESLEIAYIAGMKSTVQSYDGGLRFWSNQKPTEDIKATVALIVQSFRLYDTIDTIPPASDNVLGGVKIQKDSGLVVDSNGNLAINNGTNEDIEEIFNN